MHLDQFWTLIEASQPASGDPEEQALALQQLLEPLDPAEIVAFQEHFAERLYESYRWDLWGVAHVIQGYCSDNGFEYFLAWLVAQGREYFETALREPERAADRAERRKVESELMLYAAGSAYRAKTGESLPTDGCKPPRHPAGQQWSETELEQLYPELYQRFPKPLWLTEMS